MRRVAGLQPLAHKAYLCGARRHGGPLEQLRCRLKPRGCCDAIALPLPRLLSPPMLGTSAAQAFARHEAARACGGRLRAETSLPQAHLLHRAAHRAAHRAVHVHRASCSACAVHRAYPRPPQAHLRVRQILRVTPARLLGQIAAVLPAAQHAAAVEPVVARLDEYRAALAEEVALTREAGAAVVVVQRVSLVPGCSTLRGQRLGPGLTTTTVASWPRRILSLTAVRGSAARPECVAQAGARNPESPIRSYPPHTRSYPPPIRSSRPE